ncbi:MAG: metallopeptidase TldD-related protein [Candidatus Kapaibacterium sp.]|jgi:TldD protein
MTSLRIMSSLRVFLPVALVCMMSPAITTAGGESDPLLLKAMKAELQRTMSELHSQQQPPYFLSYCITETNSRSLSASFGKLESHQANKQRLLDLDLRVGDYSFDNTHIIRGQSFDMGGGRGAVPVPLMDEEPAIRQCLWTATDRAFKAAVERFGKAKTNKAVKVKEEDLSADFSQEKAVQHRDALRELRVDTAQWSGILRRVSARFTSDPRIYSARVYFQSDVNVKFYVNSEGSEIVSCEPIVKLFITASTKADDGMTLPLYRSYTAFSDDRLPGEAQLTKDADDMVSLLAKLREAPLAETYTGPAILSGRSAGVFFHEIFGHRVEGHRQKDPNSAQTFKSFVNKKILPSFIDVVFDPTKKQRGETDLVGYFEFDDEGVPARKVVSVKDGIFTSFLMCRSPIEGFASSNGHGRRQAGYRVVARQSNLMVEAREQISLDSLSNALRAECKRQNKEYGLLFDDISGGFTFTGRTVPNAFNVQPLVVYKIYADGRPNELVRGVDLIGTPLATFNNIIAAGDDCGIFNGVCGAESGGVPVSASSPSLLVSTIEVQKKSKSQAKPPILDHPVPSSAKP